MKVKLLEVEWKDDQIKAKVESSMCKNMQTVLRDDDLKLLFPHSLGLDDDKKVSLLQKWVGKYIEINNIKGKEKEKKGERQMKATISMKDGESFDFVAFLEKACADERITGFPKKVDEATVEMEISEVTFGRGKQTKKVELLAFTKDVKQWVSDCSATMKGISLSDK